MIRINIYICLKANCSLKKFNYALKTLNLLIKPTSSSIFTIFQMPNKAKNILSIPIENLRMWRNDSWIKYDYKPTNTMLRIQYDQLIITTENKILESINVIGKVKGILKDDVLILIINVTGQEIRKIKFKICTNVRKYKQDLSAFFPVVDYNTISKNKTMPTYRKLNDVIKEAFQGNVQFSEMVLPENYSNFVRLCLIDPLFPQIVDETEKILNSQLLDKSS